MGECQRALGIISQRIHRNCICQHAFAMRIVPVSPVLEVAYLATSVLQEKWAERVVCFRVR